MKKSLLKSVALVLASVMVTATLVVGGTVAYLQDTDSDVNVMTVGNVYIEQHEYQRADGVAYDAGEPGAGNGVKEGALVPFEKGQKLYPAVPKNNAPTDYTAEMDTAKLFFWGDYVYSGTAGNGLWNDNKLSNVMDKMVFVENTGKSDAFIRTIIAFECPEDITIGEPSQGAEIMINVNAGTYIWEDVGYITVEDVRYLVMTATYKNVLKPDYQSHPSLLQVVMTHHATNEDMELIGDSYEILVLSQAVQTAGFADAKTALDTAFGVDNVDNAAKWFKGVIDEHSVDTWDGTADTTWYDEAATEFVISTAEQLAGLSKLVDEGKTFEGKTVKLVKDIDLYMLDDNGEPICFEPIGSYRKDTPFKGVFDGQGNTISNMSQNTWALDNGYDYDDLGLGLFGKVEDATVKNLNMDKASVSGESAICGTVAATAYGDCVFENITVTNSQVADYQYYAGGIVGWASGDHQYINCKVDASTTIAAQWGDFDNSVGGVIGGCGGSATILLKDCEVACRIDAYNDVTSSYRWYAYRRAGMLIGNTGKTVTVGETTYAAAPQLTCENVTVIYDDWANYTYCEFAGTSWPYVRVQAGISNSAYSNPRYGHPTDANGNTVVDDNHVHNDGEDHFIDCTFDQLYGGGQGVYGDSTHDGVTVVYNNK
ncbi:MAG: hypothetical protein IJN63_08070 [Clostridia bacterium]|nr:hypothetical protein [Clostridia bacterium]